MAFLLKKIKSSTLVETLVSVTLLSVVAAMGMIIFWQVSGPRSSAQALLLAQQRSGELMQEMIVESDLQQSEFPSTTYHNLVFEIKANSVQDNLTELIIEVSDNKGGMVYRRKRLLYGKE